MPQGKHQNTQTGVSRSVCVTWRAGVPSDAAVCSVLIMCLFSNKDLSFSAKYEALSWAALPSPPLKLLHFTSDLRAVFFQTDYVLVKTQQTRNCIPWHILILIQNEEDKDWRRRNCSKAFFNFPHWSSVAVKNKVQKFKRGLIKFGVNARVCGWTLVLGGGWTIPACATERRC